MNYATFGLTVALCSIPLLILTVLRYAKKSLSIGGAIFLVFLLGEVQLAGIIAILPLGAPFWVASLALLLYAPLSWGLGWQLYQRARLAH